MARLLRRLGFFLGQRQWQAELDEELAFHREMKRRELDAVDGGRSSGAIARELGNLTLAREESRAVWVWRWLQSLAQDVTFALRLFRRDRGFAVTAVLVLAVGIGMTNAVFTMVKSSGCSSGRQCGHWRSVCSLGSAARSSQVARSGVGW